MAQAMIFNKKEFYPINNSQAFWIEVLNKAHKQSMRFYSLLLPAYPVDLNKEEIVLGYKKHFKYHQDVLNKDYTAAHKDMISFLKKEFGFTGTFRTLILMEDKDIFSEIPTQPLPIDIPAPAPVLMEKVKPQPKAETIDLNFEMDEFEQAMYELRLLDIQTKEAEQKAKKEEEERAKQLKLEEEERQQQERKYMLENKLLFDPFGSGFLGNAKGGN